MEPKLKPDRLLAKSVDGVWKASYSLPGHTACVVRAVTVLVDILGDRLVTQFDLDCDLNDLKSTARLAAYLHDWGKANDHFQGRVRSRMVGAAPRRNIQNPQLIRHEIVSILLAWEFRSWLESCPGNFMMALAAAGGHHLQLGGSEGRRNDEVGKIRPCGNDRIHLYLWHPDFKRLLRFGVQKLGCPAEIKLTHCPQFIWLINEIQRRQSKLLDSFSLWQPPVVPLAVIKALLVAGDAIASALPPAGLKLDRWIETALQNNILREEDFDRLIQARLGNYQLKDFQLNMGKISTRVGLVKAGCGTGKTIGAYHWARQRGIGRKLFFCYPTTGTSTEGFLDYVQEEVKSVLLHSRAEIDLAKTGEEGEMGIHEGTMKLTSFQAWDTQVIVCTVDTVLGLMQCHRRSLYCFPAIAHAAFVFDEVHSYDKVLFGALLRFLETVKAPILLMSASFPPDQQDAIQQAVGEYEIVSGPKCEEVQKRYRFHPKEEVDWGRVEAEWAAGGKILWVCNQVSTAVEIYEEAQRRNLQPLLYHSRFKYRDRSQHHQEVVRAFKPGHRGPVLAIATQVAEMSLDLSATLLVSQVADPRALIQRLGRLNRRYCGHSMDALFYPDLKPHPYPQEQRDRGWAMVRELVGEVSQADLGDWLEQGTIAPQSQGDSVLLDGKWRTYPGLLRAGGVTVTVILEEDVNLLKHQAPNQLKLYTVPIVASEEIKQWSSYRHYPIAPQNEWGYCSQKGAYAMTARRPQ